MRSVAYNTVLPAAVYPDDAEATRRLQGTTVKFDGKGYQVVSVADGRATLSPVGSAGRGQVRFDLSDPRFNKFAAFPIGWVNYFENGIRRACYVSRTSVRRVNQGLSEGNVAVESPKGGATIRWSHIYDHSSVAEMIEGVYPAYDEVIERLEEASCVAVSRRYALSLGANGFVYLYRNGYDTMVGIATGNRILINPKLEYLRDEILDDPCLPNNVEVI